MSQPELEIVQSIIAEAESKAQRTLDSARSAIEVEDAKARIEREELASGILAKAEETARKLRSREIATAHIEAQRMYLKAREEAVGVIISRIEDGLKALRRNPESYRKSLVHLAAEAVSAIGEADVQVYISQADQEFVDHAFMAELRTISQERLGFEPHINVQFAQADMGGGCIASSYTGRIVFDNTYAKRLERMKNRLRTSIVKEIIKSDE